MCNMVASKSFSSNPIPDRLWFWASYGVRQGPVSSQQLADMLNKGIVAGDVDVFHVGLDEWVPAEDVEELVAFIPSGAHERGEYDKHVAWVESAPLWLRLLVAGVLVGGVLFGIFLALFLGLR